MKLSLRGVLPLVALLTPLLPTAVLSQEGPLDKSQPAGITPEQIIQRMAEKETEFKRAREQYTYRQTMRVQTLDGDTVDGEYLQVFDSSFDDKGNRIKNVVFAPQSSLSRIYMGPNDQRELEGGYAFTLGVKEIGDYNLLYVGKQQEDELHTYVFDVAPKQIVGKHRYFQGRIWVDDQDLQIVKSTGKFVPEKHLNKKGKGQEDLNPTFTTWREQIDGKYWFPTYTLADDTLHFVDNDVHIREVVKYEDYKQFGSQVKITYDGKEVEKVPEKK
ncbi:MAG TPA: hypothetical protein VGF06_18330 [Terriglobales bacterium]|jgi:hypothetical protein